METRRSYRNENFRANKFTKSNYAAACALIRSGNSQETTNFSSSVFPRMGYPVVFITNYLRIVTSHAHFPTKEQNIRQLPKPINERSSWQTSNGTITPQSGLRLRPRVWEITATSKNCQTSRNEKYELNESFLWIGRASFAFSTFS